MRRSLPVTVIDNAMRLHYNVHDLQRRTSPTPIRAPSPSHPFRRAPPRPRAPMPCAPGLTPACRVHTQTSCTRQRILLDYERVRPVFNRGRSRYRSADDGPRASCEYALPPTSGAHQLLTASDHLGVRLRIIGVDPGVRNIVVAYSTDGDICKMSLGEYHSLAKSIAFEQQLEAIQKSHPALPDLPRIRSPHVADVVAYAQAVAHNLQAFKAVYGDRRLRQARLTVRRFRGPGRGDLGAAPVPMRTGPYPERLSAWTDAALGVRAVRRRRVAAVVPSASRGAQRCCSSSRRPQARRHRSAAALDGGAVRGWQLLPDSRWQPPLAVPSGAASSWGGCHSHRHYDGRAWHDQGKGACPDHAPVPRPLLR